MQTEFFLTRLRHHGKVLKTSQRNLPIRGSLRVAEVRCDVQRRMVKTATFETAGGQVSAPPLRDAVLQGADPNGTLSISGVEELVDGTLGDVQAYAQSWRLVPCAYDELERIERDLGRLTHRLHTLGVVVRMLPGGQIVVPGETRADDGAPMPEPK